MTEQAVDSRARHGPTLAVRRFVALALLPSPPSATLGSITLLPHQQQAAARLARIIGRYRGALLADDVGFGKTFTALAVAQSYRHVHVLAPAGLQPMWRDAIARAGLPDAMVHSLHGYSRRRHTPLAGAGRTLVIVDEAHYLRQRRTQRYANVAVAVVGCDLLLVSATPLHNHPGELRALMALFRGARADSMDASTLGALIVRRDAVRAPAVEAGAVVPVVSTQEMLPRVRRHRPLVVPQDRATLDRLLALPAPLPAHDGAMAAALIKLGLLRAWCSSDAALLHALSQRLHRGEAMRSALMAGRHPTNAELRAWVVGDDAMQLAFPELMASQEVATGPLLDVLERHLDAVRALKAHHTGTARGDLQRALHVRTIRQQFPNVPIVAFSQYTKTVHALYRALHDIAGVGLLTGAAGRIASGAVHRQDMLARFAPRASGRPPPPAHHAVTLLLATDLVAEGVNLQDAGIVVHLDLPWTSALTVQRVGRCVRLGSPHSTVHVFRLAAARPARRALRLEARIARKLRMARRMVGSSSHHVAVASSASAATWASRWHALLEHWAGWQSAEAAEHAGESRVAAVLAPSSGVMVLLRTGTHTRLVALLRKRRPHHESAVVAHELQPVERPQWQVLTGARGLLRLGRGMCWARPVAVPMAWQQAASVAQSDPNIPWALVPRAERSVLARWCERERIRHATGLRTAAGADLQRRLLTQLNRRLARCTSVERSQLAYDVQMARTCIGRSIGSAADSALARWLEGRSRHHDADWIRAWRKEPVLAQLAASTSTAAHRSQAPEPQHPASAAVHIEAVIVLMQLDFNDDPTRPAL